MRANTRKDKRALTLIEIFLVIALSTIVLGALSFSIPKMMNGEKFEKSVDLALGKITLGIDAMLNYDTDLILTLTPVREGLRCEFSSSKPLPPKAMKALNCHPLLPAITSCSRGKLFFLSSECKIPEGEIIFHGKKNMKITLPGYPKRVRREDHVIKKIKAPYPKEVLSPS